MIEELEQITKEFMEITAEHIEMFACAFMKRTNNLDPTKCQMNIKSETKDGHVIQTIWFEEIKND